MSTPALINANAKACQYRDSSSHHVTPSGNRLHSVAPLPTPGNAVNGSPPWVNCRRCTPDCFATRKHHSHVICTVLSLHFRLRVHFSPSSPSRISSVTTKDAHTQSAEECQQNVHMILLFTSLTIFAEIRRITLTTSQLCIPTNKNQIS